MYYIHKEIYKSGRTAYKKVEPIDGLSQDMYNILVSQCESKVKRLKDSMPWSPIYNEHRIFLELLKRVGRYFVEKEK